jgi:DNA-directed RNA polymerase II subunit RPB2
MTRRRQSTSSRSARSTSPSPPTTRRCGCASILESLIIPQDGSQRIIAPNEARLRNLTYHSPLFTDIKLTIEHERGGVEEVVASKVFLGKVPMLLRSKYCVLNERETSAADMYGFKECPLDVGGYFVVNGTEKACSASE